MTIFNIFRSYLFIFSKLNKDLTCCITGNTFNFIDVYKDIKYLYLKHYTVDMPYSILSMENCKGIDVFIAKTFSITRKEADSLLHHPILRIIFVYWYMSKGVCNPVITTLLFDIYLYTLEGDINKEIAARLAYVTYIIQNTVNRMLNYDQKVTVNVRNTKNGIMYEAANKDFAWSIEDTNNTMGLVSNISKHYFQEN